MRASGASITEQSEQMSGASERARGADERMAQYLSPGNKRMIAHLDLRVLVVSSMLVLPVSPFLDAFSHLYKRVCPSVRPLVGHTRVENV